MRFYYDPLDRACKSTTGAVARGSEVKFHVYCKSGEGSFSADVCSLLFYHDDGRKFEFPMKKTEDGFALTLRFHETGLWFYCFSLGEGRFLGCGKLRNAAETSQPMCWQITVYDETFQTPEWFKGGVMYQIFPDRFRKKGAYPVKPYKVLREWGGQPSFRPNEFGKVLNNDFFGGNLNGIREKLPYLAALHVTTIYLNPIFEAYSNHRYDTGDYMNIDPLLGTEEDFKALTAEAKALGIGIVLDGVFNHTGDDSRYFNKYGRYDSLGAYQSPQSPYASWYRFSEYPAVYESWWGIETLPAVNEQAASYREFICGQGGVLQNWIAKGASGWRLDVADELPDGFLKELRVSVKSADPEALIIGEVWEDASNKIAYGERRQYLQGGELDSVMNYPLKDAIIGFVLSGSTLQLRETIAALLDNYPKQTVDCLMNSLSTHDTPRILTVMGGKQCVDKEEMSRTSLSPEEKRAAKEKVRMAAVLQFMLFGVPCVFYGDEVGVEGYLDPFCRACFPWDCMDVELMEFYRKLGDIRTGPLNPVFKDGDYREIFADNRCIVFERRKGGKKVYVWCNNSASAYTVGLRSGTYTELLGEKTFTESFEIGPYSYGVLTKAE